jgi:hypothetical protein
MRPQVGSSTATILTSTISANGETTFGNTIAEAMQKPATMASSPLKSPRE